MIKIIDMCCDCAAPGYPCRGAMCSYRQVEVYYCDRCGEEIDGDIYEDDGEEICEACLKEKYRKD